MFIFTEGQWIQMLYCTLFHVYYELLKSPPTISRPMGEKNMLHRYEEKKNLSYFSQIFCKRQMKQKIMELYLAGLHASWYHTSLLLIITCNCKAIYAFQGSFEMHL